MGGPPLVLWVTAHDWTSKRMRGTLFTLFFLTTPAQLYFFAHRFGHELWQTAGLGLGLFPVVLLGTLPGLWIGSRFSSEVLRKLAFGLLAVIAIYAIVQPLV